MNSPQSFNELVPPLARAVSLDIQESSRKNLEYGKGSILQTLMTIVGALGLEEWLRNIATKVTIRALILSIAGDTRPKSRVSKK